MTPHYLHTRYFKSSEMWR